MIFKCCYISLQRQSMAEKGQKSHSFYKFSFFAAPDRLRSSTSKQLELYLLDKDSHFGQPDESSFPQYRYSQPKNQSSTYRRALDSYSDLMDRHFQLIRLQSNWLLLWNLINFFAICYFFVESLFMMFIVSVAKGNIPNEVKSDPSLSTVNQLTKDVVALILIIDLLAVRYRIRVVVGGVVFHSHGQRMHHYLFSYFIADVIALAVLLLDITNNNLGYFTLLFALKLFVAIQISGQIFYKLYGHKFLTPLIKLIRMLFVIIFFTFVIACIFVTIDLHFLSYPNFYQQYGYLYMTSAAALDYTNIYTDFDWYVWFQYALFFTLQMMVGCGYGVPTPLNPLSQFFFNISCLTVKLVFAYYTKEVFDIFTKYYQKSNEMALNMAKLNSVNTQQQLSNPSHEKVALYFSRRQENSVEACNHEKHLNSILSEQLLAQFKGFYKQPFIYGMGLFSDIIQADPNNQNLFRSAMSSIVQGQLLHQNQFLFRRNCKGAQKLYLVEWRIIKVSNQVIGYRKYLPEWSYFGLREFFFDSKSLFDVNAQRPGFVEYIEKTDFLATLKLYPAIYQKYCQLVDGMRFERGSTARLYLKCWFCEEHHLYQHCQFINNWYQSMIPNIDSSYWHIPPGQEDLRRSFARTRPQSQKVLNLAYDFIVPDQYNQTKAYYKSFNKLF